MDRFVFLVVIAVVLAVSLEQVFALKCWQCDGKVNPNCNDPFDGNKLDENTSYVDCAPATQNEQTFCARATFNGNVLRRCLTSEAELEQQCGDEAIKFLRAAFKEQTGKDSDISCDSCTTDGCNGASIDLNFNSIME